MRYFLVAVRFLTRLPLPEGRPVEGAEMPRATAYFPLVGVLIGLVTAGAVGLFARFWPLWLAVILALAFEALLTGALHEDAVADFFDAFGGGWTREDVLRILKDSRLGSFGALALFFCVALRVGATVGLNEALYAGIAAAAGLGRFLSVAMMAALPAVSNRPGLSAQVGRTVGAGQVALGALWTLPAVVWLGVLRPAQTLLTVVCLVLLFLGFRALLERRLGGTTGDCLGCLCYLAQVSVLLAASAELPGGLEVWP